MMPGTGSVTGPDGAALSRVAGARVFFGHQSVGGNVLSGLPAVYSEQSAEPLQLIESTEPQIAEGGYLRHWRIGANRDPLAKIADFDRIIRSGVGDLVDVALMKLCYVDVRSDTDVGALFARYHLMIEKLSGEYPGLTLVHVTVPLTTRRSARGRVKAMVGRGDQFGPEHNDARERFNALLQSEYAGSGRLFDLAAVESTAPNGERVTTRYRGRSHHSLYCGYAKDPGHLNEHGAAVAATALVIALDAALAGRRAS